MGPNRVLPIASLFRQGEQGGELTDDARRELRDADVIVGVDVATRREFLVYGRETLEEIVEAGRPRHCAVVHVELNEHSDELGRLLAVVRAIKGWDEYQAEV